MKKSEVKTNSDINKKLVENFVSLQKVMANLSIKFDNLSDQISKLLELFEISAKAMAEKNYEIHKDSDDKKVLEKIDALIEQNKTIAKGLTMLHEGETQGQQYQPKMNQGQQPSQQILPSKRSRLQGMPSQNYY